MEGIKFRVHTIMPKTLRTEQLRQKEEEARRQKKDEEEKAMRAKKENEMKMQRMRQEKDKQKVEEERRKKEEQRKLHEEYQQISSLKGRYGTMINQLNTDFTPLEYTISGLQLKPAQIRIFMKAAEANKTLKVLSLSRKNLSDDEGVEIAKCLTNNTTLERIELDGNNLGPRTLLEFAKLLKMNKTLRSIDFEGNNLGKDLLGIQALAEAIRVNKTLLSINLSNCNLNESCSTLLADALSSNKTIIMIDLEGNKGLNYKDVITIQEILKKNKEEYDKERFKEFVERKRAHLEEENIVLMKQQEEERKMAIGLIHQRADEMKRKRDLAYMEKLDREEEEKRKTIEKLEKEAKLRAEKKKPRRPKPAK
eukprot:TRINITY_DN11876_c0_g2_i1.p1 TRINITY_DN11876_c0_g2~~TRINITY_DN11876_c0_g2_i1.p1  ORF type:complete len:366 (+),score=129.06 TRINITY_DN11876_c0_g2_i1:73-1170(+)